MGATDSEKIRHLLRKFKHPRTGTWDRVDLDIKRHRMGWGTVLLKDSQGNPLKGVELKVRQISHDFRFGCNLFKLKDFKDEEKNRLYEEYFTRVFNEAVVPFLWDSVEPEQGKYRFAAGSEYKARRPPVDLALDWCEQNGIAPKGHWIFCDNFCPRWLPTDHREVLYFLEKRIALLGEKYGTRIRKWDCVNESFSYRPRRDPNIGDASVPGNYMFLIYKMAEKYFPYMTDLIHNEGSGESFRNFAHESSPFFLLASRMLSQGLKLNGLGMQFHMLGEMEHFSWAEKQNFFDPAHLLDVMDQFGTLGLPLHISEISLTTFAELEKTAALELQGEILYYLYRTWFSQKNCQSIVFWNLCDNTAYGSESRFNACLIDEDFMEKPAYRALDNLVNREWRTETSLVTDENGEAVWKGFYGSYELSLQDRMFPVELTPRSLNEYVLCPE